MRSMCNNLALAFYGCTMDTGSPDVVGCMVERAPASGDLAHAEGVQRAQHGPQHILLWALPSPRHVGMRLQGQMRITQLEAHTKYRHRGMQAAENAPIGCHVMWRPAPASLELAGSQLAPLALCT